MKKPAVYAALITALLSGCASVDNASMDQLSAVKTVKPVTGAPASTDVADATVDLASLPVLPESGPLPAAMPARPAMTAALDPAAAPQAAGTAATAPAELAMATLPAAAAKSQSFPPPPPGVSPEDQMIVPDTANIPVPFDPANRPSALATAYASTPTSAEMAAIQTAAPSLKPGVEVAYATQAEGAADTGLEKYRSLSDFAMMSDFDTSAPVQLDDQGSGSALDKLIEKYASLYKVPLTLVHRVVKRESGYNPRAYSKGNYGLMQIRYNTARSLGYEGPAAGLFDAETNLKYAVKYLRGAFLVADNSHDAAVRLYASGYYNTAKRKGMLDEVQ